MRPTTWVEVRIDALKANFAQVAAHAQVPVCAVVKANGYGHDLVLAAKTFLDAGAASVAVSRLEEAALLREAGVDGTILVLVPPDGLAAAAALGVEAMFDDPSRIDQLPAGSRVHLKVDTGMGRFGVLPEQALDVATALNDRGYLAGVATHFADAATSGREQLARFTSVVAALRNAGIDAPAHAANSAALLSMPQSRFDLVRIGTLLYGQEPPGARAPWAAEETFAWFARVASVRTLSAGATIGYGSEYTAKQPIRVATVPIGWADGFTLAPAARVPNTRETLATLKRAATATRHDPRFLESEAGRLPVLGRVGMQTTTVLAPDPHIVVGSRVRIPARRLSVSPQIARIVIE